MLEAPLMTKHFASIIFETVGVQLAAWLRRGIAERKRRFDQEREFYLTLNAYCREYNLCPFCEDDWKACYYCDL
jgi:hypothetical protein